MAWAKFDDHFHSNPKIVQAGNAVAGLYARCITYCADYLTDGLVPGGIPWGFLSQLHDPSDLVSLVTKAGLWEEVEGGYLIPDYLEFNPSKEEVLENRRKEREKKQRSRYVSPRESPRNSPQMSPGESRGTPGTGTGTGKGKGSSVVVSEEPPTAESTADVDARALFAYWQERCGHPAAKATAERLRKVEARLREGYTPGQVREAIDGAARAAFVNDHGRRFDDLELICRSGTKLEGFIGRAESSSRSSHPADVRDRELAELADRMDRGEAA